MWTISTAVKALTCRSEPRSLAVLRMVDRGELLAQCNLSALPKVKKPVTLAEFQRDVERSLGNNFGRFVSAAQNVNESGYAVFRVVVRGTVSQLPIQWIYYLVQDRRGHRVSLAFTLEQSLRERFAEADGVHCNAHMRSREIQSHCALNEETRSLLERAMESMGLSARAYDRILKVSRTIADLELKDAIGPEHISEAIGYRSLDREMWKPL
ncbi:hypothetical protein IIA29_07795 [candidate division KSB1 bacterium]|nr:hypothetical protein [candidate division KSB1 bacterium]